MSEDFTQPLRGDKFDPEAFDGQLLLIYPTEYHSAIPTKFDRPGKPPSQAVDCHIVGLETGKILKDARIFGAAMVPQLKGAVGGKPVLGRLGRGVAQGSNQPPWILKDFDEQEAAMARQWMAANADPRNPATPAPPTGNGSAPTATGGPSPFLPGPFPSIGTPPPTHDPNLVAVLVSKGVDISKLPPGADLALIAASLGA